MPKKKPGWSLREHRVVGNNLKLFNRRLSQITISASKAYPLNNPVMKALDKLEKTLTEVRSLLDEKVCSENEHIPTSGEENRKLISIYF